MALTLLTGNNGIKNTGSYRRYTGIPVTETIINGFFTVDHKWTVKYWNNAAEKLLGVQAKDIVGKNIWEKFAGTIPLDFYTVYHKAFLQDIPVHFEEYWGEMGAWFDVVTYHINDTLSVSFKSSNHTADLKCPEQQLKTLNELYRFLTEVTNDCLWEWDLLAKEIFWIDGGHKRVFGYQVENTLIPQSFWESHLHPDDSVRILTRLNKIIADGDCTTWEDEYRFKKANGEYAYVHVRGHIIYDGVQPSRLIGATQDITARKLIEIKSTDERLARLKEIANAVLTAQENERADIGRELHDNLNQILGAAKLYIEMAKKDEGKREICLEKSSRYIVNVIAEIRRISRTLATPVMHVTGLFDRIKILLDDLTLLYPVKIDFTTDGIHEEDLDEKLQLDIFRIVQEQLNTIIKHTKATRALISLAREANEIILLISDNGEGHDILKEKKGVDIINIRSRAELYDGKVTIVSRLSEGYKLKVVFPSVGRM
jgi:PAS domain S-box-containing protein